MFQLKSQEVTSFDDGLKNLFNRLTATMVYYNGIGIAAPQIGVFARAAIVSLNGETRFIVNPVIDTIESKGRSTNWEGCLSLPGCSASGHQKPNRAKVTRCSELKVTYQDLRGERHTEVFTEYMAHAVAHECDHLDGIFFIDRAQDLARSIVLTNFNKFTKRVGL